MHIPATHVILHYVAYVPCIQMLRAGCHAGALAVIGNAASDLYHAGRTSAAGAAAAHVGVRAMDAASGCAVALLAGSGATQCDAGRAGAWPIWRAAGAT